MILQIFKLVENDSPLFWEGRLFVGVHFAVSGNILKVATFDDGVSTFHTVGTIFRRVTDFDERLDVNFFVIVPMEDSVVH